MEPTRLDVLHNGRANALQGECLTKKNDVSKVSLVDSAVCAISLQGLFGSTILSNSKSGFYLCTVRHSAIPYK